MENLPPNDGGQPRIPPVKPPDRKSQKNEIFSAGSLNDSSEDEMPMVQALEEQPTATATKNGVSQPTGYASSFAKDLERSAKNGTTNVKPNPKFLKKKDQNLDPRTGKSQKSKTPENKQMLKIKGRKNPNPKET